MPTTIFRKIILLSIFLLCFVCLVEEDKNKEDLMLEESILNTSCNKDVINQYIVSPSIKKVIKGDHEIHKICPDLNYSCCTSSEITKMAAISDIKIDSLSHLLNDTKELLKLIKSLGQVNIQKIDDMGGDNKCFSASDTKILEGYEYIVSNFKQIEDDTEAVIKFVTRRTGSFVCELCNYETGLSTVHFRTDRYSLLVKNDYCKTFFTTKEGFNALKFFHHVSFIEPLSLTLACLHGSKMEFSPFYPEAKWKIISETYRSCQTEFDSNSNVQTEICINMCRKISPLNDNILRHLSSAISMTLIYLKHLITTTTYMDCTAEFEENKKHQMDDTGCLYNEPISQYVQDQMKNIQTFNYYLQPNPNISDNLLIDMDWSISKIEGINPEANMMKRFKSESIFAITGLIYFWMINLM